ncbi:MAG TPA: hypothetical protein VM529_18260 [Gemmata sp.]|nr:hypothetical protein [Gemmata sp.]
MCLAAVGATIWLAGCSNKNPHAPGSLSGSISYNGKPIKAGSLAFHTKEGIPYSAAIADDGTYSATDLPEGELVVTVDTEGLSEGKKAASKDYEKRMKMASQPPPDGAGKVDMSQFYVKIPRKYANPKTSPLTVTVTSGRQVKNIELTD